MSGVLLAITAVTICLPAQAHAEPSVKDLKARAERLHNQFEQLAEQYNGLRVRLQQAERAAKVAADNAARQQKALEVVQAKVSRIAATSYMSGGMDQSVALITADDPQRFLDQASTLSFFAQQDGTKVQALAQAMHSAQRARKAAQNRADEAEKLKNEANRKKQRVEETYAKVRDKLFRRSPETAARMPAVAGNGKAAQALRFALNKLGRPYVWGAAGPNAFDCSGLTMWAYQQVGISLPHFTGSQWNAGVHVSRDQLQPGDLVFFYSDLHHMGMYVGGDKMVHAPQTGDVVKISPLSGRPYAGAVRVA